MAIKHKAIRLQDDPSSKSSFNHLPSIATGSLPAAAAANEGGVVYDSTTNTVKFTVICFRCLRKLCDKVQPAKR